MAIKKRCIRCLKVLRDDGTCQNPSCVKYVPKPEPVEPETEQKDSVVKTEAEENTENAQEPEK